MSPHWIIDSLVREYLALRPNDPCLCGSGKRFAECHQLSADRKPIRISKVQSDVRRLYKKKLCYFRNKSCSSTFSASHSISRKHLTSLADDGHVLRFVAAMNPREWEGMTDSTAEPKRVGINEVSTFYGFCSFHDSTVFAPIERDRIIPTKEQSALLLYRALCRELYVKTEAVKLLPTTKEIIESKLDEKYRHLLNMYSIQNYLGQYRSLSDLTKDHARLTKDIKNKDYSYYNSITFVLDQPLPIACAGYPNPLLDLAGNLFQDYNDLSLDTESIAISSFSQEGSGCVCFTWDSRTRFNSFFSEIHKIDRSRLPDFLIQLIFAYTENLAMAPPWWDGLSQLKKKRLKTIFFPDIINPEIGQDPVQLFRYLGFTQAQIIDMRNDA